MGFRYPSRISSVQLWRRFILIQLTMPSRVESPRARSNPIRHLISFPSKMLKKIFRIQTTKTMSWKLRLLSILPSLILSQVESCAKYPNSGVISYIKGNLITKSRVWAGLGCWAWLTYSLTGLRSTCVFVVAEAKMPILRNAGRPPRETEEDWKCGYNG